MAVEQLHCSREPDGPWSIVSWPTDGSQVVERPVSADEQMNGVRATTPEEEPMETEEAEEQVEELEEEEKEFDEPPETARTIPKFLSPERAVAVFPDILTLPEQHEVKSYRKIYCVGSQANKPSLPRGTNGADFDWTLLDTETGRFNFNPKDHVAYRYECLKLLGQGTSSEVIQAFDHKCQRNVALKIFKNRHRYREMARKEAKILKMIRKKDPRNVSHIIPLYDTFKFRTHKVLVVEKLDRNLFDYMFEQQRTFSLAEVKIMTRSLFSALHYLYQLKITHCDIKPENIVLCETETLDVKLVDFGSAFHTDWKLDKDYIQTRWYRAPEVLLGQLDLLSCPVDWWSSAVLVTELFTGDPLFPGYDEEDQMAFIIEVLNVPDNALLAQWRKTNATMLKRHFKGSRALYTSRVKRDPDLEDHPTQGEPGAKDLFTFFRTKGLEVPEAQAFSNFIRGCLQWDPLKRVSPEECLDSDFLKYQ